MGTISAIWLLFCCMFKSLLNQTSQEQFPSVYPRLDKLVTKNIAMVLTDIISNNGDGIPKKLWHFEKNKPPNGLVLNCNITALQNLENQHKSCFSWKKSKFRIIWFFSLHFSWHLVSTHGLRKIKEAIIVVFLKFQFFHNRNNFGKSNFFFNQKVYKDYYSGFKTEVPIYASFLFGDFLVYKGFYCFFISAIKFWKLRIHFVQFCSENYVYIRGRIPTVSSGI